MKKLIKIFVAVVLFLGVNAPMIQAQDGKIYRVEETTVYFFDEIDYAFYKAYNAFQYEHRAYAGSQIRRAAYFVRLEANDAKAHNKKPILNQAKRLDAFADSVALGIVKSSFRLRRNFAKTHQVLANEYQLRAAAAWTKEQATKSAVATGEALKAAAGHLGHAAKWSGKKIEQGAEESVRGVRTLAGTMIKGASFVPKQVGKALAWVGNGINKVGNGLDDVGDKVKPEPRVAKNQKIKAEKKEKGAKKMKKGKK